MNTPLPPIYRDCRRLLVHTEELVRRFTRYYKYTVGTDLRQQAMALMRGVHQAVYDRAHQAEHVRALVWRVDDYKLTLQLAMEIGAFALPAPGKRVPPAGPGFAAFETAATLVAAIGQQCGGWLKTLSGQAKLPRTQAGPGVTPGAAGPQPVATRQGERPARPASLSARVTLGPTGLEVQP